MEDKGTGLRNIRSKIHDFTYRVNPGQLGMIHYLNGTITDQRYSEYYLKLKTKTKKI